jgi:hypothetical protein
VYEYSNLKERTKWKKYQNTITKEYL